eukprot:1320368-Rhodomonas_salina.1
MDQRLISDRRSDPVIWRAGNDNAGSDVDERVRRLHANYLDRVPSLDARLSSHLQPGHCRRAQGWFVYHPPEMPDPRP